jgi:hypothetical protein
MPDAKQGSTARSACESCAAVLCIALLAGCDPVSLTVFGVGAATGVQHTLNGITYKTFTAPLPQVRTATLNSLNHMGIKVAAREKTKDGELIKASASERQIEIELDAITHSTTRMRTSVRNGLFMDSATGTEIILQTEKALNNGKGASS